MVTEANQITNKLMESLGDLPEAALEDLSALHVNATTFNEVKQEIKTINDNIYRTLDMFKSGDFNKDQTKLELDEIYMKSYVAMAQLGGVVREMKSKIEYLKTFLPN